MNLAATIAFALLLPLLGGWDWLRSTDEHVESGNQSFRKGSFGPALDAYRRALDGGGDRARIHFDIGAALYKLAEAEKPGNERTKLLDRAESEFRLGADTTDAALRSSAFHNLGNTHFQRERYTDAIDAYKKSLRANPQNDDARYNLELALRKLAQNKSPSSPQPQPDAAQGTPGQSGDQPQPQPGQPQPGQGQDQPQPGGTGDQPQPSPGDAGKDPAQGQGSAPPDQQPEPGQPGAAEGQTPQAGDDQSADSPPAGGDQQPGGDRPGASDPKGQPQRRGTRTPAPDPRSESERKLEELERRSRETRRRKLRNSAHSSGNTALQPGKDW